MQTALAGAQVAEAMQKMHDRKNIGKLLLDPSLEPKPPSAEVHTDLIHFITISCIVSL